MGEAEHGGHVFFVAVVVARDAQYVAVSALGSVSDTGKYQIAVVIVAVEQKAVVAEAPVFSGQQADVLGLDSKDFYAVDTVEGLYLRVTLAKTVPKILRGGALLFLV